MTQTESVEYGRHRQEVAHVPWGWSQNRITVTSWASPSQPPGTTVTAASIRCVILSRSFAGREEMAREASVCRLSEPGVIELSTMPGYGTRDVHTLQSYRYVNIPSLLSHYRQWYGYWRYCVHNEFILGFWATDFRILNLRALFNASESIKNLAILWKNTQGHIENFTRCVSRK